MALFVEVKVIVLHKTLLEKLCLLHHLFLLLIEGLLETSVGSDEIEHDNGSTRVILTQRVIVLHHCDSDR